MSELLVYTVDLNVYHAVREQVDLDRWLRQNGVVVDETFRFEYHRRMEKLWVNSYLRDESGKFYKLPGQEDIACKLWATPVLVPPSRYLLEDLAQAVELIHGD